MTKAKGKWRKKTGEEGESVWEAEKIRCSERIGKEHLRRKIQQMVELGAR